MVDEMQCPWADDCTKTEFKLRRCAKDLKFVLAFLNKIWHEEYKLKYGMSDKTWREIPDVEGKIRKTLRKLGTGDETKS